MKPDQSRKGVIIVGLILLACIGIYQYYMQPSSEEELGNPFDGITIPEEFDQDTRDVIQGHIDRAKKTYDTLPDDWESWISVGSVRQMVFDYEGAILAYQKAQELQPVNIVAYNNIANVYHRHLQDYESAQKYYRLAIGQNVRDHELYMKLGQLQYRMMGDNTEAEKTLKEGIVKSKGHPNALIALIVFYEQTNQMDERYAQAITDLLERFPENEQYQQKWGKVAN